MPFTATAYRVVIASPSDLTEEREAATMAINDWNAQHAASECIVLLPVKWESWSAVIFVIAGLPGRQPRGDLAQQGSHHVANCSRCFGIGAA
ncbi:MAG: hypothetical protein WAN05_29905 [Roseiarcus sp.]